MNTDSPITVHIVYDFDQTITRRHTFLKNALRHTLDEEGQKIQYQKGKEEAAGNSRIGAEMRRCKRVANAIAARVEDTPTKRSNKP